MYQLLEDLWINMDRISGFQLRRQVSKPGKAYYLFDILVDGAWIVIA